MQRLGLFYRKCIDRKRQILPILKKNQKKGMVWVMSTEETTSAKKKIKTTVAVKKKQPGEAELVRKKPSSPEAELVRKKPSSTETELVRKKPSSPEAELRRKPTPPKPEKPAVSEAEPIKKKTTESEKKKPAPKSEEIQKKPASSKAEETPKKASSSKAEEIQKLSAAPKKKKLKKSVKAIMAAACIVAVFGGVMTFWNAKLSAAEEEQSKLSIEETEATTETLPETTEEPTTEEPTTEEPTTEAIQEYAPFIDYTYPIDPTKPMIALTYDDGPMPGSTEQILDVLERYNAHATFFVVGEMVNEETEDLLRREVALGCEIGNHTWEHESLRTQYLDDAVEAIRSTDDAVYQVIGRYPSIIRPPYGEYSDAIREAEDRMFIYWSLDTNDWSHLDADTDYQVLMDNLDDGDIILMHDIHQPSADATEKIIPDLLSMGYQLVTVSELMYYRNLQAEPGILLYDVHPDEAHYDSLYETEPEEEDYDEEDEEDNHDEEYDDEENYDDDDDDEEYNDYDDDDDDDE